MGNASAQSTAYTILLGMGALLVAFGYYCWTGTKIGGPNDDPSKREALQPELKVEGEGSALQVKFILTNNGGGPIRVLDSMAFELLYDVRLDFCPLESKSFEPVMPTPEKLSLDRKSSVNTTKAFNPARDMVVT